MQYINESNPLFHVAKQCLITVIRLEVGTLPVELTITLDVVARHLHSHLQINLNRLGGPGFSDM